MVEGKYKTFKKLIKLNILGVKNTSTVLLPDVPLAAPVILVLFQAVKIIQLWL